MWQNIIFCRPGFYRRRGFHVILSLSGAGTYFPQASLWGTFIVNIAGCFLLGLLSGFFHFPSCSGLSSLFTVGFCGSFTTFSTFSFENLQLLSNKAYGLFSLNIGLSLILGILFAGLGYLMTNK